MSSSEEVVRQFSGVIPGMITGQNAVAKTYVDNELALRDADISAVEAAASTAQATADAGVSDASTAQSTANSAVSLANNAQSDITGHKSSTTAHSATNITYTGLVEGAANTKQAIDLVKQRVEYFIANSGNSVAEIVNARAGEPQLNDRLNKTDAQLEDTVALTKPYNIYKEDVFGTEYLSAALKKVMAYDLLKIVFSGDSTTQGDGTTPPYRLNEVFQTLCDNHDISVSTYNHGHSGGGTGQWSQDGGWLETQDLPVNPDVMIIRWGLNDADINTGPAAANYELYLRRGLQKIRDARPLDSLSIILMTPNNVDSADFPEKSPQWGIAINDIVRRAAMDFKCCFIDTFALWRDAPNGQDWLDSYLVHPQNVANTWIASYIFDIMFPQFYLKRLKDLTNAPAGYPKLAANSLPSQYEGASAFIYQTQESGWPIVGNAYTFKSQTDTSLQIVVDKTTGSIRMRGGALASDAWGSWINPADPSKSQTIEVTAFTTNGPNKIYDISALSGNRILGIYIRNKTNGCVVPYGDYTDYANNKGLAFLKNYTGVGSHLYYNATGGFINKVGPLAEFMSDVASECQVIIEYI